MFRSVSVWQTEPFEYLILMFVNAPTEIGMAFSVFSQFSKQLLVITAEVDSLVGLVIEDDGFLFILGELAVQMVTPFVVDGGCWGVVC